MKTLKIFMVTVVLFFFGASCSKEDNAANPENPETGLTDGSKLNASFEMSSGKTLDLTLQDTPSDLQWTFIYGPYENGRHHLSINATTVKGDTRYVFGIEVDITEEGKVIQPDELEVDFTIKDILADHEEVSDIYEDGYQNPNDIAEWISSDFNIDIELMFQDRIIMKENDVLTFLSGTFSGVLYDTDYPAEKDSIIIKNGTFEMEFSERE